MKKPELNVEETLQYIESYVEHLNKSWEVSNRDDKLSFIRAIERRVSDLYELAIRRDTDETVPRNQVHPSRQFLP